MEMKQMALEILMRERISNIDMIEAIARGTAEVLFASGGTVLLRRNDGWLYFFVTEDMEEGRSVLSLYPDIRLIVAHGETARDCVKETLGLACGTACYQFAHEGEPPKEPDPRFTYRVLTPADADFVKEHYKHSFEHIDRTIEAGLLFGAEVDGKLAGFIGMHGEGSVGMLEVDPAYRRMGIASALENYMFKLHAEKGWIPYGQVYEDNEASLAVQRKIGIEHGRRRIWWMFPEEGEE